MKFDLSRLPAIAMIQAHPHRMQKGNEFSSLRMVVAVSFKLICWRVFNQIAFTQIIKVNLHKCVAINSIEARDTFPSTFLPAFPRVCAKSILIRLN